MRPAILALVAVTACAKGAQPRIATGTIVSDEEVRVVIRRALEADAAGQPADSLYAIGAMILANGRARLSPPRYAGVSRGGVLAIQNLAVEMAPPMAWGSARYQWASRDGNNVEAGAATFVLQRGDQGWRIVHAHSSLPVPWDAAR